jgi:hypothetical protein
MQKSVVLIQDRYIYSNNIYWKWNYHVLKGMEVLHSSIFSSLLTEKEACFLLDLH